MRGLLRVWVCTVLVLWAGQSVLARQVVGWVEHIRIYPGNVLLRAKVDTGAKTSSLGCECQNTFMRDGRMWLAFTVRNRRGQSIKLEKPVIRVAKIRRHFGQAQKRYVIMLGICLGNVYRESEVSVIDRSGFNYSFLVGRNFLQADFLVDPSRTFLTKANCESPR